MIPGFQGIAKIPELKKKILFTLGMLAVYRFGIFVSTPGVNVDSLRKALETGAGGLYGLVNMFSGGALEDFSIFTLGIMPYISVSIIMQILSYSVPALERLKKEGEAGQRIITKYTRWGTVALAFFQGFVIATGIEKQGLALSPGLTFELTTAATLTTGTAFIMWLGEQINERGIGNGTSVIIFAGIVARMPRTIAVTVDKARLGEIEPLYVLIGLVMCVLVTAGIIFVERSHRRIPIQYPRRMVGKRMTQAQTQYMPLKVNMAGVMPPIFAYALLGVAGMISALTESQMIDDAVSHLHRGTWVYALIFTIMMFFFSYFFIGITFNATEIADNLKKNGGSIPTVRPGKQTADYLFGVLNRLTVWGSVYLSLVCLLPFFIYDNLRMGEFTYIFGGTAILISVGVVLDLVSQIESHIVARNYESFMSKSTKVKGGIGSMGYTRARLLKR